MTGQPHALAILRPEIDPPIIHCKEKKGFWFQSGMFKAEKNLTPVGV
jgi:hypothetical protein